MVIFCVLLCDYSIVFSVLIIVCPFQNCSMITFVFYNVITVLPFLDYSLSISELQYGHFLCFNM